MGMLKAGAFEPKRKTQDLEVPELGGSVRVRQLSSADMDQLGKLYQKAEKDPDQVRTLRLFIIKRALVDENGAALCPDEKAAVAFYESASASTTRSINDIIGGFDQKAKTEGEPADAGKSEGTPPSTGA